MKIFLIVVLKKMFQKNVLIRNRISTFEDKSMQFLPNPKLKFLFQNGEHKNNAISFIQGFGK